MRKGIITLFCLLSFGAILLSGCAGSSKEIIKEIKQNNSIKIKMLNERASYDLPKGWKTLKKGIGIIDKEIYFVPFDNNSDPNFMGNAVVKCHYCQPELTVKVYSDAMLQSLQDKSKGNELVSDKNIDKNWRIVNWIGKDGEKKYLIWDKFGVEQEVALHFRVTCPIVDGKDAAIDEIEQEAMLAFNSIIISEKPEAMEPAAQEPNTETDSSSSDKE